MLEDHYIEARLHTDGEKNIDRILELQKGLAESIATPFYLVVEPKSGRQIGGTEAGVVTEGGDQRVLERRRQGICQSLIGNKSPRSTWSVRYFRATPLHHGSVKSASMASSHNWESIRSSRSSAFASRSFLAVARASGSISECLSV